MARTTEMRLVELVSLKQDVEKVIEYLGKRGIFQFQERKKISAKGSESEEVVSECKELYSRLNEARIFFNINPVSPDYSHCKKISQSDIDETKKLIALSSELNKRIQDCTSQLTRVSSSYEEALSFANLQVPYSKLEHLSFISIRIGRILKENFLPLKESVGENGVIIPLGNDSSKIMAVSSKKGHFALDTELKKFGFSPMVIHEDFKGIPEDVLKSLEEEKSTTEQNLKKLHEEKNNFAQTHSKSINELLSSLSLTVQIEDVENRLESTSMVYRITGWIPASESRIFMKELDDLTQGRLAIREYLPLEVPSVISGEEQVPVKLKHRKFVSAFERLIFSYGSPVYGNIDPTPFVALFFTLLFGIMFGDLGQGLVFLILGILMALKIVKVGGWNKFAPVFMAIGVSSSIMGLITGEFFGTEEVLEPVALFITGLFGTPRSPILKVMPSTDPNSIIVIFGIFGVTIGLGFLINSVGLILNMLNQGIKKRWGSMIFGKKGFFGIAFYWYVISFAVRIAFFKHTPALYDWILIGITLFFSAFGEPFERLFDGERPVVENGFGAVIIGGIVELIEVISNNLSSTISFVRVGAFALAHAVLGFIIELMSKQCGPIGGLGVLILGNAIVVVLEGMIVAIQVIRLQYYEFFSKFFNETGKEFIPFTFHE